MLKAQNEHNFGVSILEMTPGSLHINSSSLFLKTLFIFTLYNLSKTLD